MATDFSAQRRAGILLHITSLPSSLGNGTLGRQAYRFIDFLKDCNLSVWQMLPIHPLHQVPLNTPHRDFLSPYQPMSAFAGNPMLISLRKLIDRGWLPRMALPTYNREQLEQAFSYRQHCLKDAYFHFSKQANVQDRELYDAFVMQNKDWLEDYAQFRALKEFYQGACWWKWLDEGDRYHDLNALAKFNQRSKDKKYCLEQYYFEQFAFFTQWQELQDYARQNGVYLFGDMPFFMARDSVDVWARRENFLLDEQGTPRFLSGVQPEDDYFRPGKGQCWGHPLYNWNRLQEDNFQWWLKRFDTANRLFDVARLTHFKGFHQCWAIRNTDIPKPENAEPQSVPGKALFTQLQEKKLPLTIVTEDIGASNEVISLRNEFKFLGVKLLQIAFDVKREVPLKHYDLPHNHLPRDVVYTGTHDSNTIKGWFEGVGKDANKQKFVCDYLNAKPEEDMPWSLIRSAFQSVAKLTIIPMQDILGLDSECRMNIPGTSEHNNWRWQFEWPQVTLDIEQKLRALTEHYERK